MNGLAQQLPNSPQMPASPLAQLRDIHLPAPVAWWPPAPGWWLLAGILLAALIAAGIGWRRHHRKQLYRRLALRDARDLYTQWQQHRDTPRYLEAINRLLKQTALSVYPQRQVAALSGNDWLSFLDAQLRRPQFTEPALREFATLYREQPVNLAPEQLQNAAELWIRRHRC